jgi:hypothetical protein
MRPKKTSLGGRGGTRTLMRFLSQRPERCVATNYTTRPVNFPKMMICLGFGWKLTHRPTRSARELSALQPGASHAFLKS